MAAPTVSGRLWDNRGMAVQSKFLSIAFLCIVCIAGVGAALLWRHPAPAIDLATGTVLIPRREFTDFSLIDQHGRKFERSNLHGHWSMLFFGYTNCPDFCPSTLAMLAAMEKGLRTDAAPVRPQVIFVSVDAKRDTPAQLAQYVPYFDPEFIGVTAPDQATIEAIAKKMGIGVTITPRPDGSYSVDHSSAIFVLDPSGKVAAVLTGPFTVDGLKGDFVRIVAGSA
jgi:protein SCO1/2